MCEMLLIKITIENFKGIREKEIIFNGADADIYGDNATGKTTIYDALTWLLFDTDSSGSKNFEIKPLASDGSSLYPGAHTTVSAVVQFDDECLELKKDYYEKWSQKRGSIDRSFDGNTSDYYIDDVPMKKYQYEDKIKQYVEQKTFSLLTCVRQFCVGWHWTDRRKVLFDLANVISDRDIMTLDAKFELLYQKIGKNAMDDYKKKLTAERKGINSNRMDIPTRIDECAKVLKGIAEVDFERLENEKSTLEFKSDELKTRIIAIDSDTASVTLQNQISAIENAIAKLTIENMHYRTSQSVPDDTQQLVKSISCNLQSVRSEKDRCTYDIQSITAVNVKLNADLFATRNEWNKVESEPLDIRTTCPTCNRPLEREAVEAVRTSLSQQKELRLQQITAKAMVISDQIKRNNENLTEKQSRLEAIDTQLNTLNAQLETMQDGHTPPKVVDMENYAQLYASLTERKESLTEQMQDLRFNVSAVKLGLNRELTEANAKLADINAQLAKKALIQSMQCRTQELENTAHELSKQLELIDSMLYICDEFTRFKIQFVENSINSKFKLAKFKLFDVQVNGGVADCCEATYNGVPYQSLNNAMQINIGLDIIETLMNFYQVKVPLFIDNAESVTEIHAIDTQTIRLTVSEKDKELRCETHDSQEKCKIVTTAA